MYSLFIISFILLSVTSIRSQSFLEDLTLSASYAYESVDDRIVSVADEGEKVYQWSVGVNKTIWETRRWEMDMGLGYSKRLVQYDRSFNRCYFGATGFGVHCLNEIYIPMKTYRSDLITTPVNLYFYPLAKREKWSPYLNVFLLNGIAFHRKVEATGDRSEQKWEAEWEGLEVNPGIGIRFGRFHAGINYRLLHFRPYDPVFFNTKKAEGLEDYVGDPPYKGELNNYNPFKLWLSMGYRLGRIE
ncbi:hypothetical protein [Membranihabitans maritimus]|uniref:hypothetical protein n=1 Tax=Membranihabitans maritimus TaxID=2904244 RepID=UPI001F292C75|nr:hypothetical protein [Membranihabitans maritimus]